MTDITEVQNMSVIFVIVPTSEYNYYTAVFDAVPKDSEYEPWKIGHVEQVVAESIDKMEYDTVNYIRDLTAAAAEKERLGFTYLGPAQSE